MRQLCFIFFMFSAWQIDKAEWIESDKRKCIDIEKYEHFFLNF